MLVPSESSGGEVMSVYTTARNPAILSYYTMRRLIGLIALLLPFALILGNIAISLLLPGHSLPHPLFERSVSDYYYTPMSAVYVGSLWMIAMFLMCARGYDHRDEAMGYVTGAFTLGVSLFPSVDPRLARYTLLQIQLGYVHTIFAALMFLSVAYFCFFQFRKSARDRHMTRRKQQRNQIYAVCGGVLIACMCLMVTLTIEGLWQWRGPLHPLLVCETLALVAFGVAWLTKGEGILRDRPHERVRHLEVV